MSNLRCRILIAVSVLAVGCSPKSPAEKLNSSPGLDRTRPKLQMSLRVESEGPWPGEPTSLFGQDLAMCAERHDAPIGCVGRLHWKVENDGGGRVVVKNIDRPAAFAGWKPERFASEGTHFAYVRDGLLYRWQNEELPRRLPTEGPVVDVADRGGICYVTDGGVVHCEKDAVCDSSGDSSSQIGPLPPAFSISLGAGIGCSLVEQGEVYCWGRLSTDLDECSLDPKRVQPLAPAVSVVAGYGKACALLVDGEVRCWGRDLYGAGIMKEVEEAVTERPVRIPGVHDIVQIEAHGFSFVALTSDGGVWTWGAGQPAKIDLPMPAIDLHAGSRFCALLQDHDIRCFSPVTHIVKEGLKFEGEDAWMYAEKYVWVEE